MLGELYTKFTTMLSINPVCHSVGLPHEFDEQYDFFSQKEKIFELYCSDEIFNGKTVAQCCNAPLISGIYFNLGNQFDCCWPLSNKKVTFYGNHFALVHLPSQYEGCCTVSGRHRSMLMNVSPEMLTLWSSEYLSLLSGLEESLKENTPYIYGGHPFFIEDKLVKVINAMIKNELTGTMREVKIFSTCQMLMIDTFDHLKHFGQRISLNSLLGERMMTHEKLMLPDESTTLLNKTEDYLLKRLRYKITLEMVACKVSADPRLLTRLFQKHHNKTVMAWLYYERMKLAQQLLITTTKSVSDVGLSVGYPIQTHFTKAFKRRWGYYPRLVRKGLAGREVRMEDEMNGENLAESRT
jgi:AraC-like DNA-binding protein